MIRCSGGHEQDADELLHTDIRKIDSFPYSSVKIARVYDAYDADTISIMFKHHTIIAMKLRIVGIDSPEIRSKNQKLREYAIESRDYIRNLLVGNVFDCCINKWDKYGGRVLGDLYITDNSGRRVRLSEHLIEIKYAVPYMGGVKLPDDEMISALGI